MKFSAVWEFGGTGLGDSSLLAPSYRQCEHLIPTIGDLKTEMKSRKKC